MRTQRSALKSLLVPQPPAVVMVMTGHTGRGGEGFAFTEDCCVRKASCRRVMKGVCAISLLC